MKDQLVQLIDAYAAARGTGNATLQQFAAQQLTAFLDQVEVIEKESDGGQE